MTAPSLHLPFSREALRSAFLLALVSLSPSGLANEGNTHGAAAGGHAGARETAPHAEDKASEVAHYALHHVADDESFEMELPWGGHAPAIDVSGLFSGLQFETVPGSCSAEVSKGLSVVPSLGKWLNGCYDLRPTKAIFMMSFAALILFAVVFAGNRRDANGVPKGRLTNFVESLVVFVRDQIAVPNIGKTEAKRYTPYLLSLFFFVLFINWLGLVPGMFTGTGAVGVTAGLALLTFVLTQIAGIRSAGLGGYLGHLTGGVPFFLWPIMIPVEIIGLFTKPFALLVRLFANMLAGHLVIMFLLSLILLLHVGMAVVSVPLTMGIYCLEIFVGILQAYLFTLLTALFIGQGVAMGHHGHDEHAH
jgi:F-type H+-transporting ATPase subunit a